MLKPHDVAARARARPWAWGVVVALDLAERNEKAVGAWATELFATFLFDSSLVGAEKAREMFEEHVRARKPLNSYDDDVRRIWPRHERFPLQLGVLRLWTGISLPDSARELAMAVQLLAEGVGEEKVKDAALLLYERYAEQR